MEIITKKLESADQTIANDGTCNRHMEDKENYTIYRAQDYMKDNNTENSIPGRTLWELAERSKKRKNLILFGLPESTKKLSWEKEADDMKAVQSLIKEELKLSVEHQTASRIGIQSPRPLILCIVNDQARSDILQKTKYLHHSKDPIRKKIYIRPDMTKLQRMENNKLVSSMMALNREEVKLGTNVQWMIKRGRVVKRSPVTTFNQRRSSSYSD